MERVCKAKTGAGKEMRAVLQAVMHAKKQKAMQRAQLSAEDKGVATRVPAVKKEDCRRTRA
jgi:hypothetical protein